MKKAVTLLIVMSVMLFTASCNLKEVVEGVTISGKVTYDGQHAYPHTFVFLLNSPSDTAGLAVSNGMVADENGNYTIYRVDNGVYFMFAIADTNNNFMVDSADPIGWFGHRDTLADSIVVVVPDSIVVSGEDLTNINIDTLYTIPVPGK